MDFLFQIKMKSMCHGINQEISEKMMQFKLTDKKLSLFPVGMSSAVL